MTGKQVLVVAWALLVLAFAPAVPGLAQGATDDVAAAVEALTQAAGGPVTVTRSQLTGLATFIALPPGRSLALSGTGGSAEEKALAFLQLHGRAFGIGSASEVRVARARLRDEVGMDHVRIQQMHDGVPVTGAELWVHLRGGQVVAANGHTLPGLEGVATSPTLDAATAVAAVRRVLEERLGVGDATVGEPRLEVFNRGLLEGVRRPTRLAWFVEATQPDRRDFFWVDATRGGVLLHFSQRPEALARSVYTAASTPSLPGTLIRTEGGPPTADPDADLAYDYLGDTYNYFFAQHGRDSFDGAGGAIVATVHFCPSGAPCPFPNASWNGTQMVFGEGFSRADDVDAHELTHAVTEHSANLFYYMQSGALNESFSDVFGETVDLTNGKGSDTIGTRWVLGEDLAIGATRHMMNPNALGDPGKMSDAEFACGTPGGDAGGVHTNSGVPNHAYALMVDGGTYNGITVAGIGLTKAGKIEYRALTLYLGSASDFLDDYDALKQSCVDLTGTAGITAADCAEVTKALDAVEMSHSWPCSPPQAAVPPLCPAGKVARDLFRDDFESGYTNWRTMRFAGRNLWFGDDSFATSGTHELFGFDDYQSDDSAVVSPDIDVPPDARLQFNHAFGFDDENGTFFDGGVVEFSFDGGLSWGDAMGGFRAGAHYGGEVSFPNPLLARRAFVGESWGYTATQVDINSPTGRVRLRFRIGTDPFFGDYGWFIDDVRIYVCADVPRVTVADVSVFEGHSGTQSLLVTVSLSTTNYQSVTVRYATADGTALAGSDYRPVAGTLTFAPRVTSQTVVVPVMGDRVWEPDETFAVNLSDAVNATIQRPQGVMTIRNDDADGLSIADVIVKKPASGTTPAAFTVTLSPTNPSQTVTVQYATADGTAVAGTDYEATGGTLTFAPGTVTQPIVVPVKAGPGKGTARFLVNLSSPDATVAYGQGTGTIVRSQEANDLNGDGHADIVWRNVDPAPPGGAMYLWMMDGRLVGQSSYLDPIGLDWSVQGVADFSGDGKADILWRQAGSGSTYLWLMDGPFVMAGTGYTNSQADEAWRIQAVGDLNGDGKADIVWRKVGAGPDMGALFLWMMDGATIIGATYLDPISTDWQIQRLGDFNGDGRADILWREAATGDLYIWMMNGPTVIAGTGYPNSQADNGWQVQGVGDLDGDGKADIVWRKVGAGPDTGALFLWRMDGTSIVAATYLDPISTDWQVRGLADFNGDGRSDILWRSTASGENYMWMMNGSVVGAGTGYTGYAGGYWQIVNPH